MKNKMQDFMVGVYLTKHAKTFHENDYNLWNLFDLLQTTSGSNYGLMNSTELKLHILSFCILEISPRTCPPLYYLSEQSISSSQVDDKSIRAIERAIQRLIYGRFDSDKPKPTIHQIYYHFHISFDSSAIFKFNSLFDRDLMMLLWSKARSIHSHSSSHENYFLSFNTSSVSSPQHDDEDADLGNHRYTKKRKVVSQPLSIIQQWSKQMATCCKKLEQLRVQLDYNILEYMINDECECICPLLRDCETVIDLENLDLDILSKKQHRFAFVTRVECIFSEKSSLGDSMKLLVEYFLPKFPQLVSLVLRKFNANRITFCSLNPLQPLIDYSTMGLALLRNLKMDMNFSFKGTDCISCWSSFWNNLSQLGTLEDLDISIDVDWKEMPKKEDIVGVVRNTFGFNFSKQLSLPKLKNLSLHILHNANEKILDQSLLHFLLQCRYDTLNDIDIDFNVTNQSQLDECLQYLYQFDEDDKFCTIRKLKLVDVSLNSDNCYSLGCCQSLKWLILKNVKFIGEDDYEKRYCLENLASSNSINHLELPGCHLEEYFIEPILSNMNQLELLNLKFNNVGPLILLRHITISFSTENTDDSNQPKESRNNLVHLYALNLEGNTLVTKEHIDTLLEQNENLTYLTPQSNNYLPLPAFTWQ